jgi:hypothetical protein
MSELKKGTRVRIMHTQAIPQTSQCEGSSKKAHQRIHAPADGVVTDDNIVPFINSTGMIKAAVRVRVLGRTPKEGVLVPLDNLIAI